ncbi:MAG: glycosyltransferase [Acidobacteria bacterium]|nr:glycosyltransferase [Acidobacteriota bacterium]
MKILFVLPNVPSLVRPRPFHFIRGLSKTHELTVVCLATNETDERSISDLRPYCRRLEVIRHSRWRALANCLRALVSRTSLRSAYFYSPRLREHVRASIEAGEADLIHVEHLKSLPMVEPVLGRVPAVFDAVDCLSMLESRRRRVTRNLFLKLFSTIESKKFAASERRAPRRFNRVAISSSVDRAAYPVPANLREKIDIVPNGVDLDHFRFREFEAQRNLLVFCAKLDYFPNADAALYFARSIWPRVRARRPELRLEIVGSRPPGGVRRLDGEANIRVTGSVPDVKPYLGRAWVALCPIRIRAGIQNKMLEAMALGVPVVATSICCPGLEVEAEKHLLVADDAEQFAAAIELLLDNETLRERLIEAARDYVERRHSWRESVAALSNSYRKAMADFKSGAGESDSSTYRPPASGAAGTVARSSGSS